MLISYFVFVCILRMWRNLKFGTSCVTHFSPLSFTLILSTHNFGFVLVFWTVPKHCQIKEIFPFRHFYQLFVYIYKLFHLLLKMLSFWVYFNLLFLLFFFHQFYFYSIEPFTLLLFSLYINLEYDFISLLLHHPLDLNLNNAINLMRIFVVRSISL